MDIVKPEEAKGPCAGFRVLEFGTLVAGPMTGQSLGDLGAEVIKVEPIMGDISRWTGPPERGGINGFFSQFNRNKRAISVDIKSEQGQDIVRRLARQADVMVVSYRPGIMDKLGLGYRDLSADNPGLIYVHVSGFGPDGPYSERPVYDLVIQGMSGAMPGQGGDGKPEMIRSVAVDKASAIAATSAALAALLARERNGGEGQMVNVPMMNAYGQFVLPDMMTPEAFRPKVESEPFLPNVFHVWTCRDGYLVGMPIEDKQYANLCHALGLSDLVEDERFAVLSNRLTNLHLMIELVDAELDNWNWRDALDKLHEHDVPFAPVYQLEDFMEDPQAQHNRVIFDAEDPQGGTTRYVRHPGVYEKTPASLRRHPPRYGEHTEEILAEAGFSGGDIERFRADGVVA